MATLRRLSRQKLSKLLPFEFMSLWYPGRPPFCSDELIWLLTQYIETLHELNVDHDGHKLEVLFLLADEALIYVEDESDSCNGTDSVLNNLRELFHKATEGAKLAFQNQAWDSLFEIATNITVVRDELREKHEEVTV